MTKNYKFFDIPKNRFWISIFWATLLALPSYITLYKSSPSIRDFVNINIFTNPIKISFHQIALIILILLIIILYIRKIKLKYYTPKNCPYVITFRWAKDNLGHIQVDYPPYCIRRKKHKKKIQFIKDHNNTYRCPKCEYGVKKTDIDNYYIKAKKFLKNKYNDSNDDETKDKNIDPFNIYR